MRPKTGSELVGEATQRAIHHISNTFAVVGVVERYDIFVDLVQHLLDPLGIVMASYTKSTAWWDGHRSSNKRKNVSPQSTSSVISLIKELDRSFMMLLNASVMHEWKVYGAAVHVSEKMHRERLGQSLTEVLREDAERG